MLAMRARVVVSLAAAVLAVSWARAASAQTYTITRSIPQSLAIAGVKAGDLVTVEATLFSGDPNENGEGEPLVLGLPAGPFVVSRYASPRTLNFLALVDGQTVSAYIQGADGDEAAVVNFEIAKKPRFTPEEKARYADLADRAAAYALALSAAANYMDPIRARIANLGEAAEGALAVYYNRLSRDPPDPDFTQIPQPQFPALPPLQPDGGAVTQALADAFDALQDNQEHQIGYIRAILECINRAGAASDAGSASWESAQLSAAAQYAQQAAALIDAGAAVRATLLAALQATGLPAVQLAPFDVFLFEFQVIFEGLPDVELEALARLGVSDEDILLMTQQAIVQDVNEVAGIGGFPGALADPVLAADEAAAAAALRSFAARYGPVPLARGQMVQAQGWFVSAGERVTFSIEAHLEGSDALQGKLVLHAHASGFSLQQGAVADAGLFTGTDTFVIHGTSAAGQFTATGDAAAQTIAIEVAGGPSFSGALQGGNVKVKR